MGPNLAATLLDLIGRLDAVGRRWLARRLFEAAIRAGIVESDQKVLEQLPADG
jgi:hypothetical protein